MHPKLRKRRHDVNVARAREQYSKLPPNDQLFVHQFLRERALRGVEYAATYANGSWDATRSREDFIKVKCVILGMCGLDPILQTKLGDDSGTPQK